MSARTLLVESILESMLEVAAARSPRSANPWLRVELSMAELKTIFVLHGRGSLRVGEIGETLGLSPNATTAVIDRLQQRELVERLPDPQDRRGVLVDLLAAGRTLIEELLAAGTETMRRRLDAMATADLAALNQGLAALAEQIREEALVAV